MLKAHALAMPPGIAAETIGRAPAQDAGMPTEDIEAKAPSVSAHVQRLHVSAHISPTLAKDPRG
eukprot:4555657-Prymnesium_polylepis.1